MLKIELPYSFIDDTQDRILEAVVWGDAYVDVWDDIVTNNTTIHISCRLWVIGEAEADYVDDGLPYGYTVKSARVTSSDVEVIASDNDTDDDVDVEITNLNEITEYSYNQ